jgi:hypothetical protein
LAGVRSRTRAPRTGGGVALLGIAVALAACSSAGTPSGSSSRSALVTTISGGETCAGRSGPNDLPTDVYQRQYASGLANQLKDRLKNYDSAVDANDDHRIGDTASALDDEIRADARLVDIPRLYGCYDQRVLTGLQNATTTLATTLDALSCAGNNTCSRKPTEVPGLVAEEIPQERTYVQALNAYAAQFGGEQLPLPRTSPG